jgi:hypothetical protein
MYRGPQPDWYEMLETMAPNLDVQQLVAERPENRLVSSSDVVRWSLRQGRFNSRLRLELLDGGRRKVLWSHYTSANPFPPIQAALTRSLRADRRTD